MKRARTLSDLYSFSGFRAQSTLTGVFGDPDLRVVHIVRKKRRARVRVVDVNGVLSTIGACRGFVMSERAVIGSNLNSNGCA